MFRNGRHAPIHALHAQWLWKFGPNQLNEVCAERVWARGMITKDEHDDKDEVASGQGQQIILPELLFEVL